VKAVFVLAAAMLAAPLAAEPSEASIRVAGEQSSILAGAGTRYIRGEGDMLFVRGRNSLWYQVDVNKGCLSTMAELESLNFGNHTSIERIDRFTEVRAHGRDGRHAFCRIDSIRRVEIEPQAGWENLAALD
jgi:hypothetical protein